MRNKKNVVDMTFLNHFRGIKKMSKDMYVDFEVAWAEYEYVSQVIKEKVEEILNEDQEQWIKTGAKDSFHHSVEFTNGDIIIQVKPILSLYALQEISNLIGSSGRISVSGTKKNMRIKIKFTKNDFELED